MANQAITGAKVPDLPRPLDRSLADQLADFESLAHAVPAHYPPMQTAIAMLVLAARVQVLTERLEVLLPTAGEGV